jgi:hypothetical protein
MSPGIVARARAARKRARPSVRRFHEEFTVLRGTLGASLRGIVKSILRKLAAA